MREIGGISENSQAQMNVNVLNVILKANGNTTVNVTVNVTVNENGNAKGSELLRIRNG